MNTDLIYGTRAVMEAIRAGKQIEKILVQTGLNNDLIRELASVAREKNLPVTYVPLEKLNRLYSNSKNHQGVICVLSAITYSSLNDLIDFAYSEGREPFFIILDRVTDVRNFGAIARTAECAGVEGIIIGEKGNAPITGDAMKTSAGALNHLPVCREPDLKKTLKFLRDNGIMIVSCTEKAEKSIYDITFDRPVALIMGSEEDGISDVLLKESDELAKIPLHGKIESLNVSVATGIAVYEVVRQKNIR
ncbi:MAG TPA: 23S rRNA (guanosine(2251)-2'-O)-methyltransferase RlmB [Cyclobacteriaceae bacterium]|nr:23S rRNA (guanosine(2251)-2'-O)-methyltransferase RlmB [Cyclobacteriaceae bacterium]